MASISTAAETEDQLTLLRALRDKLAWEIDNCSCARDLEPLVRRLAVIGEQIADLVAMQDATACAADEIRARRQARLAGNKRVVSEHDVPASQRRATRRKTS